MTTEEIKKRLSNYLAKEDRVIFAFMYGSYANGTNLKDSDLDIGAYFKEGFSSKDVDNVWDKLQDISKKDVELLTLNNAKEMIGWQAIRGKSLVIKDWDLYLKYMLNVSFDALDFQEDLKEMWMIKKGLKYA